jgi:hypothetical protein
VGISRVAPCSKIMRKRDRSCLLDVVSLCVCPEPVLANHRFHHTNLREKNDCSIERTLEIVHRYHVCTLRPDCFAVYTPQHPKATASISTLVLRAFHWVCVVGGHQAHHPEAHAANDNAPDFLNERVSLRLSRACLGNLSLFVDQGNRSPASWGVFLLSLTCGLLSAPVGQPSRLRCTEAVCPCHSATRA